MLPDATVLPAPVATDPDRRAGSGATLDVPVDGVADVLSGAADVAGAGVEVAGAAEAGGAVLSALGEVLAGLLGGLFGG